MSQLLLVDGANFNYSLRYLLGPNPRIDLKRFFDFLAPNVEKQFFKRYYVPLPQKEGGRIQGIRGFIQKLKELGFTVITRRLIEKKDKQGKIVYKANLDVEMALDFGILVTMFPVVKELILISGDGDLVPVVEQAKKRGIKVKVVAAQRVLSRELREAVGEDGVVLLDGIIENFNLKKRFVINK